MAIREQAQRTDRRRWRRAALVIALAFLVVVVLLWIIVLGYLEHERGQAIDHAVRQNANLRAHSKSMRGNCWLPGAFPPATVAGPGRPAALQYARLNATR